MNKRVKSLQLWVPSRNPWWKNFGEDGIPAENWRWSRHKTAAKWSKLALTLSAVSTSHGDHQEQGERTLLNVQEEIAW